MKPRSCPRRLGRLGEFHTFEASGQRFAYMVPSAAVFAFDDCSAAVSICCASGPQTPAELLAALGDRVPPGRSLRDTLDRAAPGPRHRRSRWPARRRRRSSRWRRCRSRRWWSTSPTSATCRCEYCYEYGEDKIVDTENGSQPKFMSEETAQAAIDFALTEAGVGKTATSPSSAARPDELPGAEDDRRLRAAHRRRRSRQADRLQPHHQRHAAASRTSSTSWPTSASASPSRSTARRRSRTSSASSATARAATTSPRRRSRRCWPGTRSRPIGARVTLTTQTLDVMRIYRHLFHDRWASGKSASRR